MSSSCSSDERSSSPPPPKTHNASNNAGRNSRNRRRRNDHHTVTDIVDSSNSSGRYCDIEENHTAVEFAGNFRTRRSRRIPRERLMSVSSSAFPESLSGQIPDNGVQNVTYHSALRSGDMDDINVYAGHVVRQFSLKSIIISLFLILIFLFIAFLIVLTA